MSYEDLRAKIVFLTDETEGAHDWVANSLKLTAGQIAKVEQWLETISASPTLMAKFLEMTASAPILVSGFDLSSSQGKGAFGVGSQIAIDFNQIEAIEYFSKVGTVIDARPELILAHEFAHLALPGQVGVGDPDWHDLDFYNQNKGWDFDGGAVRFQNAVAVDLGLPNSDLRTTYQVAWLERFISFPPAANDYDSAFPDGTRYTLDFSSGQDSLIDIVWVGEQQMFDFLPRDRDDEILSEGRPDGSRDLAFGLGADDTIRTGDGADFIYAGDGVDTVEGGAGRDHIYGGAGEDSLDAGEGDDVVFGGEDDDTIKGGAGNDTIDGGEAAAGNDDPLLDLVGAGDEDTLDYSASEHRAYFYFERDPDGSSTSKFLRVTKGQGAEGGADTVRDIETVLGSAHGDALVLDGNTREGDLTDTFVDLRGHKDGVLDTIDATGFQGALTIDLRTSAHQTVQGGSIYLELAGAEAARGTVTSDTLRGGVWLEGRGGGDTLEGNSGSQVIIGGSKDGDVYSDDGAADTITSGGGADRIYFGDNDVITDGGRLAADAQLYTAEGAPRPAMMSLRSAGVPVDGSEGGSGRLLTGGESEAPPANPCDPASAPGEESDGKTYIAADGTEYTLEGGRLTISYDGGTAYIDGFRNGKGGIRLKDARPATDQAECQRDPLIIDLDGDRNVVRELFDSFAYFDLDNDGFREHVAWTLSDDGFLVRDRNGNGSIDNGAELFGSGRAERDGGSVGLEGTAGFAELALLDSNSDGLISAADVEFATLRVWIDANGDALTDDGELKTLAELGLVSISLSTFRSDDLDCGCDGTQVEYASNAFFADGRVRSVYDAYLSIDQYDTREIVTDVTVPADFAALPFLLGTGTLSDLDVAMARDPGLEEMVRAFAELDMSRASEILDLTQAILLRWTGADAVAADSRGPSINARWLAAIEQISGSAFEQAVVGSNPRADAAGLLIEDWREIVANTAAKLLGQTALGQELLPGLSFEAAAFFTASDGSDLGAILAHASAQAPAGGQQAVAYWAALVNVLDQYRGALGLDAASYETAVNAALASASVPFTIADLRMVIVADRASGKLVGGNGDTRVDAPGEDVILLNGEGAAADGAGGNDRYVAGRETGSALIRDSHGVNTLYLVDHGRADITVSAEVRSGRYFVRLVGDDGTLDVSFGLSINDSWVSADIDIVVFADGTEVGALALLPTSDIGGNLVIGGSAPGEIIAGDAGDELLVGLGAANTYGFGPGDGNDTIADAEGHDDRLVVGAGRDEVTIAAVASDASVDLVLTIVATGETVRIAGQQSSVRTAIERIVFTDGSLTAQEIDTILATGTSGDDVVEGSARNDDMRGLEGNDTLRGGGGRDAYHFDLGGGSDRIVDGDVGNVVRFGPGIGRDNITLARGGPNGSDLHLQTTDGELVIVGGLAQPIVSRFEFEDGSFASLAELISDMSAGPVNAVLGTGYDDDLTGTAESDRFIGNGGRDRFTGNGGLDTYEIGTGGVTIEASDLGIDTAFAPAGSTLADFRFSERFGLWLDFGAAFAPSVAYGSLDNLVFDNGDTLTFGGAGQTIGTSGNDFLYHRDGSPATFTPGAGDDVMIGGTSENGRDIYQFEAGFGHDTIYDMGGRLDEIRFTGDALSRANATLARQNSDLVISFLTGDRLTVEGFFWNYSYPPDSQFWGQDAGSIETVIFGGSSNTFWSAQSIVSAISKQTTGDDWVMTGSIGGRDGGAGNDILVGGERTENYYFRSGYGHDVIKDEGSSDLYPDTVYFVGLASSQVSIARSSTDPTSIVFTIDATGETLTIDGTPNDGFNAAWDTASGDTRGELRIETYRFSDVVLTRDQVAERLLAAEATAGDDHIHGFNASDRIDGGAGDDRISIQHGADTIVLTAGGGHDVLDFLDMDRNGFSLEFVGIDPEEVALLEVREHGGKPGRHLLVRTGEDSSLLILNGLDASLYPVGSDSGMREDLFSFHFPDHGVFGGYGNQQDGLWLGRLAGPQFEGTDGADILQGFDPIEPDVPSAGRPPIDPRGGDDLILGSGRDDTLVFDVGYGTDRYEAMGSGLTVVLGEGLSSGDITLRWLPDEPGMVELAIIGTDDRLLFDGRALTAIEAADVVLVARAATSQDPDLLTPFQLAPGVSLDATSAQERFVAIDGGVSLTFGATSGHDFFEDARFRSAVAGEGDLAGWAPSEVLLTGGTSASDFRYLRYEADPADLVIVGPSGERLTIRDQFAFGGPVPVDGWRSADRDSDGQADWTAFDMDGDGAPDFASLDSDGDGVPNWVSPDFDGDGLSDWTNLRYAYAGWETGYVSAQDLDLDGNFDIYRVSSSAEVVLRDVTGDGAPDEYSLDEVDWIAGPTNAEGTTDWSLLDVGGDGTYELEGFGSISASGLDWISGYSSGPDYRGWQITSYGELYSPLSQSWISRWVDAGTGAVNFSVPGPDFSSQVLARDLDSDGIPDEVGIDFDFDGLPDASIDVSAPMVVDTLVIGDPDELPPWVDPRVSMADIAPLIEFVPTVEGAALDLDALKPAAGAGADILLLTQGAALDTLAGNDVVASVGGGGTLHWSAGDGNDVLRPVDIYHHSGGVAVRFDGVSDPGQLRFLKSGANGEDLVVEILATGERLRIEGQLGAPGAVPATGLVPPVARFVFEGGLELSAGEIALRAQGVDLGGANVLTSDSSGGLLDGGAGADLLLGGSGNDVYRFADAYEEDRIRDAGGTDRILFGEGIASSSVHFSRAGEDGQDLLIEVMGADRLALTVEGQFADPLSRIETLVFEDGESLSWRAVQAQILDLATTAGDDTIAGFAEGDTLSGGDGQDELAGGGGDDLIFGGAGRDVAVFSGTLADYTITFGQGFVIVSDNRPGGDGVDRLENVEDLSFLGDGSAFELVPANLAPAISHSLAFGMAEDSVLSIPVAQLLAAASDPDGDTLQLVSVSGAVHGRAWVGLDGDIRFRADGDFGGSAEFSFTVSDGKGGAATGTVAVEVSQMPDAPRQLTALDAIAIREDSPIDFAVPTTAFADADGDPLVLAARLADGGDLPSWLEFDGVRLTGTPPPDFHGTIAIEILASDGTSTAAAPLGLTIVAVNDAPRLVAQPSDQTLAPGEAFVISLPAGSFADPEGDAISYRIIAADGRPLPAWLSNDGLTLTGTMPEGLVDPVRLAVVADDGRAIGHATFSLVPGAPNGAPEVAVPIGTIHCREDEPVSFSIPADAFVDPDGDPLSYSMTLADGGALPEWLAFDGAHLSGMPPADFNGVLDIEVVAADGAASAVATFRLSIDPVNDMPAVLQPLVRVSVAEDGVLDFELPEAWVADVDGDVLQLALAMADGSPLPGWLTFDGDRLTGSPPANFHGSLALALSASDGQSVATDAFTLAITPVNDAPTLVSPLADRQVTAGQPIDWSVPAATFLDVDGDALSYTAALADGSALPSWLSFDGGRFTGQAAAVSGNALEVMVSASDGTLSASDRFVLTVVPGNSAPTAAPDGLFVTTSNREIVIDPAALLANDADADGDQLTITAVGGASRGEVELAADGRIVYTPDAAFVGSAQFSYTVSDGVLSASTTVAVRIDPSDQFDGWRSGNEYGNILLGSLLGANRISGLGGNDAITGGLASDYLAGGDGADALLALTGDDHLWGGQGDDLLFGGPGLDTAYLFGYRSSYTLETQGGILSLRLRDGAATVDGNDGVDQLSSIERLSFKGGDTLNVVSPIVLDLGGDGIQTLTASQSRARFDFDGDGRADDTSWIGANDAFLFLDRNGDGRVSSASEITFIDDMPNAASDLAGLRAFDSSNDGMLDSADERFLEFGVWRDVDGDGKVDRGESVTLAAAGIAALDLAGRPTEGSTALGGVAIVNTGTYTRLDGTTHAFADAALTYFSGEPGPRQSGWRSAFLQADAHGPRIGEIERRPWQEDAVSARTFVQDTDPAGADAHRGMWLMQGWPDHLASGTDGMIPLA